MNSTLHLSRNTHILQCRSLIIADTNLLGVDLGSVSEGVCERMAKHLSTKVLDTNLLMATTFPPGYPCPNLIQECIHMYNVSKGTKLRKEISVLLNVNRETMSSLFHLEEEQFSDFTPTLFVARFSKKASDYKNVIAKN